MLIEIYGLIFSIILGTLGHFLYEWTNKSKFIGYFFATNESIWQHLKLGISPILLWTIIELLTFNFDGLFFSKFISIFIFTASLLIMYYAYKALIKKDILFLDILIFYISLFLAYFTSIKLLSFNINNIILNLLGFLGLCSIFFIYKKFNNLY